MLRAPQDNRGVEPKIGDTVVCNVSGQLAAGMLVGKGRRMRGPYSVELYHRAAGMPAGHVSKIQDVRSLLVIEIPHDLQRKIA